ncbi:MAG: hypothetical protein SFW36_09335 [Leptolyngbyaceae cyanobacterium bins.59]|nr:hypothetical protein [Leptolyngbyaceae cyanobacterium bins.59]
MPLVDASSPDSIRYSMKTWERAERAVRCSPFQTRLFLVMWDASIPLRVIAGKTGVQNRYLQQPIGEVATEGELLWLIQVGVLRREVDGQGLTDSFRLTPLGRQLVEKWRNQGGNWLPPSWRDRLQNFFSRWIRIPL